MDQNPASGKIAFFKQQLCHYSKLAAHRGLFCGEGEFLSVRIPGSDIILIMPEETGLEGVAPEETLIMNLKSAPPAGPERLSLPANAAFLIDAYLKRQSISAIGHFHPPYATAFSTCAKNIPFATHPGRQILKEILWVKCTTCPSRFAGLCECIEGQRQSYGGVNIIMLEADGIVTLGANLKEVFYLADWVESNARSAYFSSKILHESLSQPYGPLEFIASRSDE